MPETVISNLDATRLKEILSTGKSYEERFLYLAISTLLEELVGEGTVDDIIESLLPSNPTSMAKFGGYPLGFFAGLGRTRIKEIKRRDNGQLFSDADVDAIFTALGVVEGEGVTTGAQVVEDNSSVETKDFQESSESFSEQEREPEVVDEEATEEIEVVEDADESQEDKVE